MAIGSKELAPVELDTFEDDRLVEELRKAKEELFNLRFQSATGQLDSHGRIRAVKRDIARIYTVVRERELGIRATPAPLEATPKAAKTKAPKKSKKADADVPASTAKVSTDKTSTDKPGTDKTSTDETSTDKPGTDKKEEAK